MLNITWSSNGAREHDLDLSFGLRARSVDMCVTLPLVHQVFTLAAPHAIETVRRTIPARPA